MAATGLEVAWDVPALTAVPWGKFTDVAIEIPVADTSTPFGEFSTNGGTMVNRAGLGITFVPHSCEMLYTGDLDCTPTENVIDFGGGVHAGKNQALRDLPTIVDQPAFKILDALRCSSLSRVRDFLDGRVRMRMDILASAALAREAVTARASGGQGFDNNATVLTAASSITLSFFALEEALAGDLNGAQGMIHMSPGVLAYALNAGYVRLEGDDIFTVTGHRVIADAGYRDMPRPNTGVPASDATHSWVYATGPVHYQLSNGRLLNPDSNQESMQLSRNIFEAYAEASAVIAFNPCSVFATRVTLT